MESYPLQRKLDLKPLIDRIGQARIVLLGESTHGTHEFYEWRRLISEWLIVKKGFNVVAVEGDWPSCAEVNRYIHSESDKAARDALQAFQRWPTWMWANLEVSRWIEWMKTSAAGHRPVHFYGMDIYSLFESIDSVLQQLRKIDPFLAKRARDRYECFASFRSDEKAYLKSLWQIPEGCTEQVLGQLQDMLSLKLSQGSGGMLLDVIQNTKIVANAERYYRSLLRADNDAWNIRENHMIDTLETLLEHHGPNSKMIVWAHNTHVGDHQATTEASLDQQSIGSLARDRWGHEKVALVGFGTSSGQVVASRSWSGPLETMTLPDPRTDSHESVLHLISQRARQNAFTLLFSRDSARNKPFHLLRPHRGIGVVYQPRNDSASNYTQTLLSDCYDAFIYFDHTSAISPFILGMKEEDLPNTWPIGK